MNSGLRAEGFHYKGYYKGYDHYATFMYFSGGSIGASEGVQDSLYCKASTLTWALNGSYEL